MQDDGNLVVKRTFLDVEPDSALILSDKIIAKKFLKVLKEDVAYDRNQ